MCVGVCIDHERSAIRYHTIDFCLFTDDAILCEDCPVHAAGGDNSKAQHHCQATLYPGRQWKGVKEGDREGGK